MQSSFYKLEYADKQRQTRRNRLLVGFEAACAVLDTVIELITFWQGPGASADRSEPEASDVGDTVPVHGALPSIALSPGRLTWGRFDQAAAWVCGSRLGGAMPADEDVNGSMQELPQITPLAQADLMGREAAGDKVVGARGATRPGDLPLEHDAANRLLGYIVGACSGS